MASKYTFIGFMMQCLVLTMAIASEVVAQKPQHVNDVVVYLEFNHEEISNVFKAIEAVTDYRFTYHQNDGFLKQSFSLKRSSITVKDLLLKISKTANIGFEQTNNNIAVKTIRDNKSGKKSAVVVINTQEMEVSGTVISQDENEPLPGVNVVIKGSNIGATTDIDGKYTVNVPDASSVLIFSFIGFATMEVPVNNRSIINVSLQSDIKQLSEVVVVGYGVQEKRDVTGSASRLSEENFNQGIINSPEQLLQGKVAGLQIVQNSGEPGASATMRIRGASSIRSNNDPLYVIDGVPLDISSNTLDGLAGAQGITGQRAKNPLNFINPDDIESIDVLKDASAAAIYGARGANGVVLITTKKGSQGVGTLSYSTYVSMSEIPKLLPVLSAQEFVDFREENGLTSDHLGANTNWQDEIFRTAFSHNHSLSFSGGNEITTYRASISYLDQEGIIEKSSMNRYTGRINATHKALNERLNLTGNLTFSRIEDNRVPIGETGGFEGDLLATSIFLNPTFPVRSEDGSYYQHSQSARNPVAMIDLTDDNTVTNRILGNLIAEIEIFEGLKFQTNVGIDNTVAQRRIQQSKELIYMPEGRADVNTMDITSNLMENYFTYNKQIGNDHRLTFLLGYSYQRFLTRTYNIGVTGFPFQGIPYADNLLAGASPVSPTSSAHEMELQSFFARANYSLLDKYIFTATIRRDGSTRFGTNNKYGNFPSFALAWRLGDETFVQDLNFFSDLKLRIGYGVTGNQEFPNKISQVSVTTNADAIAIVDGKVIPGLAFNTTPNPDIKWEETRQWNFGIDFGFIQNRLSGSIDYYNKTTKNFIYESPALSPSPVNTTWSNIEGEIINRGVELGLTAVLASTNNFEWTMDLNASKLSNDVKGLPSMIITGNASGPGLTATRVQVIANGEPMGSFYGLRFLGFDEEGLAEYSDEETFLGSALPDYTFGFTNTLRYGNFDLSFFFNGVQGNKVYNNTMNGVLNLTGVQGGRNTTRDMINTEESIENPLAFSSRFIEDGSFIRLNNATLGYTLSPQNIEWLQSIRIYVTGTNLFLITNYSGYDPEVNTDAAHQGIPALGIDYTNYPRPRSVLLGLNFKF